MNLCLVSTWTKVITVPTMLYSIVMLFLGKIGSMTPQYPGFRNIPLNLLGTLYYHQKYAHHLCSSLERYSSRSLHILLLTHRILPPTLSLSTRANLDHSHVDSIPQHMHLGGDSYSQVSGWP